MAKLRTDIIDPDPKTIDSHVYDTDEGGKSMDSKSSMFEYGSKQQQEAELNKPKELPMLFLKEDNKKKKNTPPPNLEKSKDDLEAFVEKKVKPKVKERALEHIRTSPMEGPTSKKPLAGSYAHFYENHPDSEVREAFKTKRKEWEASIGLGEAKKSLDLLDSMMKAHPAKKARLGSFMVTPKIPGVEGVGGLRHEVTGETPTEVATRKTPPVPPSEALVPKKEAGKGENMKSFGKAVPLKKDMFGGQAEGAKPAAQVGKEIASPTISQAGKQVQGAFSGLKKKDAGPQVGDTLKLTSPFPKQEMGPATPAGAPGAMKPGQTVGMQSLKSATKALAEKGYPLGEGPKKTEGGAEVWMQAPKDKPKEKKEPKLYVGTAPQFAQKKSVEKATPIAIPGAMKSSSKACPKCGEKDCKCVDKSQGRLVGDYSGSQEDARSAHEEAQIHLAQAPLGVGFGSDPGKILARVKNASSRAVAETKKVFGDNVPVKPPSHGHGNAKKRKAWHDYHVSMIDSLSKPTKENVDKALSAASIPRLPRALAAAQDQYRSATAVMTRGNSRFAKDIHTGPLTGEVIEDLEEDAAMRTRQMPVYKSCFGCGRTYMAKGQDAECPTCSVVMSKSCSSCGYTLVKSIGNHARCPICSI
jgi:hypothetical protein